MPSKSSSPSHLLVSILRLDASLGTGDGTVRRIGVLGGAFDPPHLAHQTLARSAVAQLGLDTLHIVPTGQAVHRPGPLTSAQHRLSMVQLAFADLASAAVDDRETTRSGPSYTIDTLHEIMALWPGCQLFLILGADQARVLHRWKAYQDIIGLATICFADRACSVGDGCDRADAPTAVQTAIRQVHLQMPMLPISATDIRTLIAAGADVTAMIHPQVARYIAHHHLYTTIQ